MLIPPRRLVLSGGGIRALAHVGALEVLEQKGLLKAMREIVGVSAGAFVGFTVCLGYTIQEIKTLCSLFDFSMIRNLDPEAALEFPNSFGFDDGENLVKLLHSLLRIKGLPTTLTFGEWFQRNPNGLQLRCFATDICMTEPREFSVVKTPNVSLVHALRASMSLPVYFTPVLDPETGHMLIDGGILHNFPLAFLSPEEREHSLGISFSYDHTRVDSIPDLLTFFSQIFACYYIPRTNAIHSKHKDLCIIIPCGEIPAWNFEVSRAEREGIMNMGKEAAEAFWREHTTLETRKKPIRRYSVT
jgi:NTE family protein